MTREEALRVLDGIANRLAQLGYDDEPLVAEAVTTLDRGVPPLVAVGEAAELLDQPTANVSRTLKRAGVEPVQRLTRGALYRASDVERVAAELRARRAAVAE